MCEVCEKINRFSKTLKESNIKIMFKTPVIREKDMINTDMYRVLFNYGGVINENRGRLFMIYESMMNNNDCFLIGKYGICSYFCSKCMELNVINDFGYNMSNDLIEDFEKIALGNYAEFDLKREINEKRSLRDILNYNLV